MHEKTNTNSNSKNKPYFKTFSEIMRHTTMLSKWYPDEVIITKQMKDNSLTVANLSKYITTTEYAKMILYGRKWKNVKTDIGVRPVCENFTSAIEYKHRFKESYKNETIVKFNKLDEWYKTTFKIDDLISKNRQRGKKIKQDIKKYELKIKSNKGYIQSSKKKLRQCKHEKSKLSEEIKKLRKIKDESDKIKPIITFNNNLEYQIWCLNTQIENIKKGKDFHSTLIDKFSNLNHPDKVCKYYLYRYIWNTYYINELNINDETPLLKTKNIKSDYNGFGYLMDDMDGSYLHGYNNDYIIELFEKIIKELKLKEQMNQDLINRKFKKIKKKYSNEFNTDYLFSNLPKTMMTLTTYQDGEYSKRVKGGETTIRGAFDLLFDAKEKLIGNIIKKIKKCEYFYAVEPHKTAYPHMHIVFFDEFTEEEKDRIKNLWSNKYEAGSYDVGVDFSDESKMNLKTGEIEKEETDRTINEDDCFVVSNYVTKYIEKMWKIDEWTLCHWVFYGILWEKKKRSWGCSNGLKQIMKLDEDEDEGDEDIEWYEAKFQYTNCMTGEKEEITVWDREIDEPIDEPIMTKVHKNVSDFLLNFCSVTHKLGFKTNKYIGYPMNK
ncbi:MAG: hypothetical protein ACOCP4_03495 [Candidatus Woesearchaeota archaeon]